MKIVRGRIAERVERIQLVLTSHPLEGLDRKDDPEPQLCK